MTIANFTRQVEHQGHLMAPSLKHVWFLDDNLILELHLEHRNQKS